MSFDTVLFTEDENQALTRPQEAFLWRSGIPREQSRTETQAKQASQRQPRTPHGGPAGIHSLQRLKGYSRIQFGGVLAE